MKEIKERGGERVGFRVRVQPSASKSELLGWNTAGELRIKVAARPVRGAANKELLSFLARCFSLRRRDFRIETGGTSRVKTVSAPASIREALIKLPDI